MVKNNVTRMLVSKGIPFQAFELPTEKLSGLEAAQILGVDPELVFKTIVSTRAQRSKPIMAMVPAPGEVDLKALARIMGEKKVFLASQKDAERITGLQVGGISPLALLSRGFQVVIDSSAESLGEIYISGGKRGINIRLTPHDLIDLTNARIGTISR